MTVIVGGLIAASATIGAAGGAMVGAVSGFGIGSIGSAVGTGTASGIAGATGSSATAGAIIGSVSGGGIPGAVAGAIAGAITGAASNAGVASLTNATTLGALPAPVGAIVLGVTPTQTTCTFDCWKPVLHDDSSEPSNGRLLKDIVIDPRIKQVTVTTNSDSSLPQLILQNIWDEQFLIEYVSLPFDQIVAHAVQI